MNIGPMQRACEEILLRWMTPKRQQTLIHRWRRVSKLGFLRLTLIFVGVLTLLALCVDRCMTLIGQHAGHPFPPVSARIVYRETVTVLGCAMYMSSLIYFPTKMWVGKIARWKAAGRL